MSLVILAIFTNLDSYVGNLGQFYQCQWKMRRSLLNSFAAILVGIVTKFLEFLLHFWQHYFLSPCYNKDESNSQNS